MFHDVLHQDVRVIHSLLRIVDKARLLSAPGIRITVAFVFAKRMDVETGDTGCAARQVSFRACAISVNVYRLVIFGAELEP
jgi:hypothetical protein